MNGWKTYAVAAAIVAWRGLVAVRPDLFGPWDATVTGLLGAGGLAALRHGVSTEAAKP